MQDASMFWRLHTGGRVVVTASDFHMLHSPKLNQPSFLNGIPKNRYIYPWSANANANSLYP